MTFVIIIGAGIAGLSAAHELHRRGVDYILIEARDRIGGRIKNIKYHGRELYLGANWIHDANPRNSLLKFLKE